MQPTSTPTSSIILYRHNYMGLRTIDCITSKDHNKQKNYCFEDTAEYSMSTKHFYRLSVMKRRRPKQSWALAYCIGLYSYNNIHVPCIVLLYIHRNIFTDRRLDVSTRGVRVWFSVFPIPPIPTWAFPFPNFLQFPDPGSSWWINFRKCSMQLHELSLTLESTIGAWHTPQDMSYTG